ncbi:MAG: SprT family zinc-dependent metalloprotease [Pseudomonadota bacterium]
MPLAPLRKLTERLVSDSGEPAPLLVDGRELPVEVKRNARARRIIMRMNPKTGGITLTLPPATSVAEGVAFAQSNVAWIAARLKRQPDFVPFADGAEIPLRGEMHRIRHLPSARGTAWSEPAHTPGDLPALCVAGRAEHLERRLRDWLKAEARKDLVEASAHYADKMGLKFSRIAVRDQSSRWGSCSSNGTLSYSWRLILAPGDVLDYVAAHEVAHLAEMNHGPRFWRLVETNCAQTGTARHWLRQHGMELHKYGR